jgi:hypothetical protein
LDSNGQVLGVKIVGTADYEVGEGITIDENNNIYIIARFRGNYGSMKNPGNESILMGKINSSIFSYSGFSWIQFAGTSHYDYGNAVIFNKNRGLVYITGSTTGSMDDNTNQGWHDAFILKYDSQGNKK